MSRLPQPGGDAGNWGDILNDYLTQVHEADGTLKTDTVGAPQLKPNSVTNAALADGTVQETKLHANVQAKLNTPASVEDGSVTTAKLADGAVTNDKLDALGSADGIASLDNTGKLPEAQVPERLSESELSSTITSVGASSFPTRSSVSPATWPGGARRLFVGDSITNGSSASSSANFFVTKTGVIAGSEVNRPIREGFPGERADQLANRLPDLITTHAPEAVHFQAGTNDVAQGRTVVEFITAMDEALAACAAAGIPMTTGTVFARSSGFASHLQIAAYNLALRDWCVANDVPLADTFGAVADPLTGYLRADFDAGDGTHPNNAGHLEIAHEVSRMIFSHARRKAFPVTSKQIGNLLPNPLQDSTLGGWSAKAGVGPTGSWVPSSGEDDLTAGGWRQYTYDNTSGGSTLSYVVAQNIDMTGVEAGDVFLLAAKVEIEGASGSVQVSRGSVNVSRPVDGFRDIPLSGMLMPYTVQVADIGQTMSLGISMTVPVGETQTIRIGQMGVFNRTKLGLS